jgi:hypothetical protein
MGDMGPDAASPASVRRELPPPHQVLPLRRGVIATIDPPGAAEVPGVASTVPWEINNRGQVVGQYADARGLHAYLLDKGRYKTIDPRGVPGTVAADINDRGQIVIPKPRGLFIGR